MYLSISISREATKMNTDLYDYPMIAFPCPEKNCCNHWWKISDIEGAVVR